MFQIAVNINFSLDRYDNMSRVLKEKNLFNRIVLEYQGFLSNVIINLSVVSNVNRGAGSVHLMNTNK